ncbi:hypothetical protein AVEN_114260-1 [Araneus ventricosus]|uniref:Secreted protein n=1 Tax=Araneus ventricosus TaxID=182803 RepID=A0A4Y2MDJ3_ARAVE|nr:hypothetical protein AVEN_114260-1 [Araneus ventricosus]
MSSCCPSVCFLLLMDSTLPPRVGSAWRPIRRVVHFGPWCINRPVSHTFGWSAQGDKPKGPFNLWTTVFINQLLRLSVKGDHCPPERIGSD